MTTEIWDRLVNVAQYWYLGMAIGCVYLLWNMYYGK